MDEKRISIAIGGSAFFGSCLMSIIPELNYPGMIIGALIVVYGFIGPLNWSEFRLINPFSKRIKLSDASLKALESLENTSTGSIANALNPGMELKYYAHALADGQINKTVNVYGRKPPSRVVRFIESKDDHSYFSADANSSITLSGKILYTDLEIERKWLHSYISQNKRTN